MFGHGQDVVEWRRRNLVPELTPAVGAAANRKPPWPHWRCTLIDPNDAAVLNGNVERPVADLDHEIGGNKAPAMHQPGIAAHQFGQRHDVRAEIAVGNGRHDSLPGRACAISLKGSTDGLIVPPLGLQ
jgi:hypothetical protein